MNIVWESARVTATLTQEFGLEVQLSEAPDSAWYGSFLKVNRDLKDPPWYGKLDVTESTIRLTLRSTQPKDVADLRETLDRLVAHADELSIAPRQLAERLTDEFSAPS